MTRNSMTRNEIIQKLINPLIKEINPKKAVKEALKGNTFSGDVILLAIGKAAWRMAHDASQVIVYKQGFVLTKYKHSLGKIPNFKIFEAGHPLPDGNSIKATNTILENMQNLDEFTTVILLLSGGGSALFEALPEGIELKELIQINDKLLKSGASINEINCVRKHLSLVKGGRLAELVYPAQIHSVIISDVIGDEVDSIASGPAVADESTSEQAKSILDKYKLILTDKAYQKLEKETPIKLTNSSYEIIASNQTAIELMHQLLIKNGYDVITLDKPLTCDVQEAVRIFLQKREDINPLCKTAILAGGEVTVKVNGTGKGGRNTHFALLMKQHLKQNQAFLSLGTDGTDGPTDAGGGLVFGRDNYDKAELEEVLLNFDSYNYLNKTNELIKTGATGTNLNDVYLMLIN